MSVLHVITGLGTGGAEQMLVELVRARAARGSVDRVVSLLPCDGANVHRLEQAGVPVHSLGMRRGYPSVGALRALVRIVRAHRPDIVQGWMYHGDLAATLALFVARRRGVTRLLWGVRCSDMDTSRYGPGLRLVIRACAFGSAIPDAVVVNSEAGRDAHAALGYRPRRFVVVDNGIDVGRFRPDPTARERVRAALGIAPDSMVVVHVARVDPMKDHESFLAALRSMPAVTGLAVGAGTEALGEVPNLLRLGVRDDVPELLAASDVICSSSAYGEGFSNALAEGMAAALVPVATDVGDARRIVGQTGEVVPAGDVAALVAALARTLEQPADERLARGDLARRRIAEQFSLERAIAAFDAIHSPERGDEGASK